MEELVFDDSVELCLHPLWIEIDRQLLSNTFCTDTHATKSWLINERCPICNKCRITYQIETYEIKCEDSSQK